MQLATNYKHTGMKVNAISYILAKWVKSVIWEANSYEHFESGGALATLPLASIPIWLAI